MAVIPFALNKLIKPGPNDPRIEPRLFILHVDAGNAFSLFGLFSRNQRGNGIESHGHIRNDGVLEQYRDTDYEADANYLANPIALSFETQGFGGGKWTAKQLSTIKRAILWAHRQHGIPLQVPKTWDGSGVGYHVLFGAPGKWTPVAKSCPGPKRIKQFRDVLVPWLADQARAETAQPARPALGKYTTRQRVNRRDRPDADAKVLSTLRAGATVNITAVHWDEKRRVWFGRYRTRFGNKRWIPMRNSNVQKKG
ncbi:peptidoglycan recognition protein family protein [Mumia sp. DW29H23]|uniref:peptidoglycan recognition protein family protein n=1 Tax=Mumia sp. DW29H23 TaxID=3421241 RepID=UPI003D69B893